MAEFCLECWNKINDTNYTEKEYVISKDLYFCENCCDMKNVVVAERKAYYKYKFRFIILPFKVIYFLWRIFILPYLILKYIIHSGKEAK